MGKANKMTGTPHKKTGLPRNWNMPEMSPATIRNIYRCLKAGMTWEQAANYSNVHLNTIWKIRQRAADELAEIERTGARPKKMSYNVTAAVIIERGREEYIQNLVSKIHRATDIDWKAAQYLLQVADRKRFSVHTEQEIDLKTNDDTTDPRERLTRILLKIEGASEADSGDPIP